MKYAQRMVLVPESDRQKARIETDRLAKSIRMKDQAKVKQWETTATPPGVVPQALTRVPTSLELSSSLPRIYQLKGQRLLDEMLSAGFMWTPAKELILPSTEIVPNSNLEAILKEALVRGSSSAKPIGWQDFIAEVSRSTIPLTLLTKRSTQQDLKHAKKSGGVWEIY